jgi:translation initiation factor 6 (aeIF-6)
MVMNNRVSEEEEEFLKGLFGNISQSTANTGSLSIGLSTIANSSGVIAGSSTTGYELSNIAEGLGLE